MAVASANPLNDSAYIEEIRSQMLKFARLQLRDADAAADERAQARHRGGEWPRTGRR